MNNKKKYVKMTDEDMYKEVIFDAEMAKLAARQLKELKNPTSVALDPQTIFELKELSEKKGIPYQVLMRSFILEGLERMKKES